MEKDIPLANSRTYWRDRVKILNEEKNKNNEFMVVVQNALKGAVDLNTGNRIPFVKKKLVIHKSPS